MPYDLRERKGKSMSHDPQFISAAPSSNDLSQWINPLIRYNSWTGSNQGTGKHIYYKFTDTTAALETATKEIFDIWANLSNLTFEEDSTQDGIEINYDIIGGNPLGNAIAHVTEHEFIIESADITISNTRLTNTSDFNKGQLGYITIIHEIGHALGLVHGNEEGASNFASAYVTQYQNIDYSIMNSFVDQYGSITSVYGLPSTPQFADISAIQYLYGANTSYNSEDSSYDFLEPQVMTIWDGGGTDTIDATAQVSAVTINLNEADGDAYSTVGASAFWIASGANIENALGGSSHDTITGNALANTVKGMSGNDLIRLNDGTDWANGNAGIDYIFAGNGDDNIRGGKDQDSLTGESGADFVNGNNGNDTVLGGTGADTLHGGQDHDTISGEAGNDQLFGDKGNDTLTGGSGADTFIFNVSNTPGIDTITDFVSGTDTLELRNSSFTSATDAFNAITSGVLDLGGGHSISGLSNLNISDIDLV